MYQRTVLPNGIRIVTEHLPYLRSVTLGLWFEVGSRDEEVEEWGISHFIEHMMFKGTEIHSAREIAELMDQRGGHLNAFTGKEQTCYYFKVLDDHFSFAAKLLQDMLLNSLFLPEDVEKEKNVVLEELNMYQDSPEELVHDLFSEVLVPHSSLGRNILGSEGTIASFTPELIQTYLTKHYTADRLVIACVGNVRHDQVVEAFAPTLDIPQGVVRPLEQAEHEVGGEHFWDKEIEQIHLCVGGPAFSRLDPRKYALHVLDAILGGGVSSLLFQELREERGLVYNTYSFTSLYRDLGFYGVYAGFRPQNWGGVWELLEDLFRRLPDSIDPDRVERAKSQLKGSLVLSQESTTNRMFRLAKGELDQGRIITPEEVIAQVEGVQHQEVQDLAASICEPSLWSWVGVGPRQLLKEEIRWQKIC